MLHAPSIWLADKAMSYVAGSKKTIGSAVASCITIRSLDDPLLIAFIKLRLSHKICTGCLASCGPHTMQLRLLVQVL